MRIVWSNVSSIGPLTLRLLTLRLFVFNSLPSVLYKQHFVSLMFIRLFCDNGEGNTFGIVHISRSFFFVCNLFVGKTRMRESTKFSFNYWH